MARISFTPTPRKCSDICRGSRTGVRTSIVSAPAVDGQLVPIPINLDTINQLYGTGYTSLELESFFASVAEPRHPLATSEDVIVNRVGRELYEKFFRNYTRKQWGLDPSELDACVTARVPVRTNRDDRYFTDTYQAMPRHGYTRMFERMLDHPNIHVLLNSDYREIKTLIPHRELIYTGPVDEYFDYCFGKLPYRSLRFECETRDVADGAACAGNQLPERLPVHAGDRIQVPDRPGASRRRRWSTSIRPTRAIRTIRCRPRRTPRSTRSTRRSPTPRRRCSSSAGLAPTSTTTWTRCVAQALAQYAKMAGVPRREIAACMTRSRRSVRALGRRRMHVEPGRRSYSDQMARSGHIARLDDLDRFAAPRS